jgi:hypothetical protein
MLRLAAISALLALALQAPAQMFSHGAPASALSPTADGREHGIPAGATSPTPRPFGVNPPLRPIFIHRRPLHRHPVVVPVPIYYPIYGPGYDYGYPSVADPQTDQSAELAASETRDDNGASVASSEEALRMAYLQGARDALAQQREQLSSKPAPAKRDAPSDDKPARRASPDSKPEADDSPATIFIFKDGRKIETRNYAVMGTTLYDLSGPGVKKVQLTDLDTAATIKANDDRGITVKLP